MGCVLRSIVCICGPGCSLYERWKSAGRVCCNRRVARGAGRDVSGKLLGIAVCLVFAGVGVFTVTQNWWPGYLFCFFGALIALASLYSLGKAIVVKIDKHTQELSSRESWMGLTYSRKEAQILEPEQFKAKKTSTMQQGSKVTEFYAINLKSGSDKIRIADGIKSKAAARALRDELVARCFQCEADQHQREAA